MTPASPADSPTATRRVNNCTIHDWLHERADWIVANGPKAEFDLLRDALLDLRDSRVSEVALHAEIAELKRKLERERKDGDRSIDYFKNAWERAIAAEAKLADAERAGMSATVTSRRY